MKVKTMQAILVVAGILVRDGKIMISRRPAGAHMGMKWEFPGGKIETGETPEDALRRELMEETGAEVEAVRIYGAKLWAYPEKTVLLLFYMARLLSGEPRPLEGQTLAWVKPAELGGYAFAPADETIARRLMEETAISDI